MPQQKKHRVTPEDIGVIHSNREQEQPIVQDSRQPAVTMYYTTGDFANYDDEKDYPILVAEGEVTEEQCEKNSMAKKVTLGSGRDKYYIRMGDNGILYDPWGLFTEKAHRRYKHHEIKQAWPFREVGHTVFTLYTTFLKTRNKQYLRNAQREAY